MSNVKSYTDKQILARIKKVTGATPTWGKYMIVGIQSQEDAYNKFDDKFYVFDGPKFIMVSTGTTNAGSSALKNYTKYMLPGAAVWKTNEFYKDLFIPGLHKGKMKALRQDKPIKFYRDANKNNKAEEGGVEFFEIIYANMHGVDYNPFSNKIKTYIGGWSFGCQVWNKMSDYRHMIKAVWKRNKPVDYALLKEW